MVSSWPGRPRRRCCAPMALPLCLRRSAGVGIVRESRDVRQHHVPQGGVRLPFVVPGTEQPSLLLICRHGLLRLQWIMGRTNTHGIVLNMFNASVTSRSLTSRIVGSRTAGNNAVASAIIVSG